MFACFPGWLIRCAVLVVLTAGMQAQSGQSPTLDVEGVGKGTVALTGPWAFHTGDDAGWARAEVDDAAGQGGWETLSTEETWGAQTHFAYAGFGWYRRHLRIAPAPGVKAIQVSLPAIQNVCAVYWNGELIGTYGKFPPLASSPVVHQRAVFTIPGAGSGAALSGVLAIRVYAFPLGSSSSGLGGGLAAAPVIGDPQSIAYMTGNAQYQNLMSNLYFVILTALYAAVSAGAFLLWLRRRRDGLLLWFAIFAACPVLWGSVGAFQLNVSNLVDEFFVQVLFALRSVALWFLLIDLLELRDREWVVRWARRLAVWSIGVAFLDACLAFVPTNWLSQLGSAWVDAVFTVFEMACEAYLFVLIPMGFRRKLDSTRWVVALAAFFSQLLTVVTAASQQGSRFTHWTLAQHLYSPIFSIGGTYFTLQMLADTVLLLSILYAVFRSLQEQQARRALLEQELHSARELQNVLIPEKPPTVPGFAVTSAYTPALEVGGDFFQIIPLEQRPGSTLIVLGDVSGKGLRAAMAVSLIIGAIRTAVETVESPAELLAAISRRLYGRLQGGFTTCVALRLDPGGVCTLASAGHPAPYINEREVELPGALPLGIAPETVYEEITVQLGPGDRMAMYTDGLLEARSASGEVFSFDRLQSLMASAVTAESAAQRAVEFGQDDDITVLTVTRLAATA